MKKCLMASTLIFQCVLLFSQKLYTPLGEYYQSKEQYVQSQNWGLTHDSQHNIYVGNNKGVIRFNGTNWELIETGLVSTVRSLHAKDDDCILVGSIGDFGIMQKDAQGFLKYHSLRHLLPEGIHFQDVWSTKSVNGTDLFLTDNYIFCHRNDSVEVIGKKGAYFYTFQLIRDVVYVHEIGVGLQVFSQGELKLLPNAKALAKLRVHGVFDYDQQHLVVMSKKQGLFLYHKEKGKLQSFDKINPLLNKLLKKSFLYSAVQIKDQFFALGTINDGVYLWEANHSFRKIKDAGLGFNEAVYSLDYVEGESLWCGLEYGVSRVDLGTNISLIPKESGLDGTISSAVSFQNEIYVTSSRGFYCVDESFQNIEGINGQNWYLHVVKKQNAEDSVMLIANYNGVYEFANNKPKQILVEPDVYFIKQLKRNKNIFLLGTRRGVGVLELKAKKWKYHGLITEIQAQVRHIEEDKYGNVWIGANYQGVLRVNTFCELFEKYKLDIPSRFMKLYGQANGLNSLRGVQAMLYRDSLLFATEKGILSYDRKKDRFVPFTAFGEDLQKGKVWVNRFYSSGKCLWLNSAFKITGDFDNIRIEKKKMAPIEGQNIYTLRCANGTCLVGTRKGLYLYENRNTIPRNNLFHVSLSEISLKDSILHTKTNSQNVEPKYWIPGALLWMSGKQSDNTFQYAQQPLRFSFSAPYHIQAEQNQFSYRLKGDDGEWSKWSTTAFKEYNQLREGIYTFQLKARNIYHNETEIINYHFEIRPPWYRSFVAYFVYLGIFILLVYVLIRLNIKRLKREKEQLEQTIQERTKEIAKQNASIKQKNLELLKLSKIASETDNAISMYDEAGDLMWVNEAYTRMYGYCFEELGFLEQGNLIKGSTNPQIQEAVQECIENGVSVCYEYKTRHKNGSEIWAHTTLSHVMDEDAKLNYIIAIESDITSLKKAADEIIEQKAEIESQRDELARVNATKDRFFSVIAHDLRNPVSSMVGFSNLLVSDFDTMDRETLKSSLDIIGERSRNVFVLMENLLDWARCQMGKVIYTPQQFNFISVVKECVELSSLDLSLKKLNLNLDLEEHLPIRGDENMLRTIVRNLLGNAIKYTNENGNINVKTSLANDEVIFEISDNGIGMDAETINNILTSMVNQSHQGTNLEKGIGIGLVLCREFIEINEGRLEIESELDKGSKFRVYFKLAPWAEPVSLA